MILSLCRKHSEHGFPFQLVHISHFLVQGTGQKTVLETVPENGLNTLKTNLCKHGFQDIHAQSGVYTIKAESSLEVSSNGF